MGGDAVEPSSPQVPDSFMIKADIVPWLVAAPAWGSGAWFPKKRWDSFTPKKHQKRRVFRSLSWPKSVYPRKGHQDRYSWRVGLETSWDGDSHRQSTIWRFPIHRGSPKSSISNDGIFPHKPTIIGIPLIDGPPPCVFPTFYPPFRCRLPPQEDVGGTAGFRWNHLENPWWNSWGGLTVFLRGAPPSPCHVGAIPGTVPQDVPRHSQISILLDILFGELWLSSISKCIARRILGYPKLTLLKYSEVEYVHPSQGRLQ